MESAFKAAICKGEVDDGILRDHFRFVGTIPPTDIQSVYDAADVLVTLSDLESFSNNYMEAWKVGIPIIASDRDFAHEICGDSALYVEPHDSCSTVRIFELVATGRYPRDQMLAAAKTLLASLPTTRERYESIWREIDGYNGHRTENSNVPRQEGGSDRFALSEQRAGY
jgi:glycosyltransferase involved in cell wall biosynthesis